MDLNWLEKLTPEERERALFFIAKLRELGEPHPEYIVKSEVEEDVPQVASFLFLRMLWREAIDYWRDNFSYIPEPTTKQPKVKSEFFGDGEAALQRMVNARVDPVDIARFARMVAYKTTFHILYGVNHTSDPDVDDDSLPGWGLMETDGEGNLTGRTLDGLYESLLSCDPSGREGRPGPDEVD